MKNKELTIEERIKIKEEEIVLLKAQQEKEKLLKEGALKTLENNILKDVLLSSVVCSDGEHITIHFKLNDEIITINYLNHSHALVNLKYEQQMIERISEAIKNKIYQLIVQNTIER